MCLLTCSKSYNLLYYYLMMQLKLEYFYINDIVPELQCNFSSFLIELTFFFPAILNVCHSKKAVRSKEIHCLLWGNFATILLEGSLTEVTLRRVWITLASCFYFLYRTLCSA